jgi:hypothetical protein
MCWCQKIPTIANTPRIRFASATRKSAALAEVKPGDQLRAKGDKSEDGLKVTANEVVFGTFVTKAGTITAVDVANKSIAIKELNTNKELNVKLTADSQLKQMPNFAGMGECLEAECQEAALRREVVVCPALADLPMQQADLPTECVALPTSPK